MSSEARRRLASASLLAVVAASCSGESSSDDVGSGGSGTAASGGSTAGSSAQGGTSTGATAGNAGSAASGGTSAGGTPAGGTSAGGTEAGGTSAGSSGTGGAGGAGAGGTAGAGGSGGLHGPEMGTRIAFFGDQGLKAVSHAALQLIKDEGADLVLHLGDFDYNDDPAAWKALMSELGTIPWLAVVGNHDTGQWNGYQQVIQEQLATIQDIQCVGEPGVQQACVFHGLQIVLSGIGLLGSGHEQFIGSQLDASAQLWRICGWHLNQRDMQLGDKSDQTGWNVHQECQQRGAMIVNGHEHSYGRTLTLSDVGNVGAGHGAAGDWDLLTLGAGKTFVTVNGMGGESLRAYDEALHDDDTWWSDGYTNDAEINDGQRTAAVNFLDPAGVVFLEFGVDGDPARARGTMKSTGGKIIDEFTITMDGSGLGTGTGGTGGTGGSSSGGTAGTGSGGWDPTTCTAFCGKCDTCFGQGGGFDEGDCRYQLSTGFALQDCLDGCAAGQTPAFDPTTLPGGWESWSCSQFDSNI
jgi:hypothetical protein